jgi:hypothetical protein
MALVSRNTFLRKNLGSIQSKALPVIGVLSTEVKDRSPKGFQEVWVPKVSKSL